MQRENGASVVDGSIGSMIFYLPDSSLPRGIVPGLTPEEQAFLIVRQFLAAVREGRPFEVDETYLRSTLASFLRTGTHPVQQRNTNRIQHVDYHSPAA